MLSAKPMFFEDTKSDRKAWHHPTCVYAIQRPAKIMQHQTSMETVAANRAAIRRP